MSPKTAPTTMRDGRRYGALRLGAVRRKIVDINETTPWDVIIPASFFLASAVCWADPTAAPSILFALMAMATVFVSPVMQYYTRPATDGLMSTVTEALNTITDEENKEQREKLFYALADLISKSIESAALQNALKESLLGALMADDLHDTILNTLQTSLVKASENEGLRQSVLDVVRIAFTSALGNEQFVSELMSSIVGAIVQASKEDELTKSVLDVVTVAVSQALADERFVAELRGAIKDTLQDGEIYKAGARGMVTAAFGQRSFLKGKSDVADSTASK